jgi:hypothetical protein
MMNSDNKALLRRSVAKFDTVGLIFSGIYTAYFVLLTVWSHFANDIGATLLAQFSIAPGGMLVGVLMNCLGLKDLPFALDSWINSVYVFYLPSLLVSYLCGWATSATGRLLVRLVGGRLDRLDERLLDHFDKDA